MGVFSDFNSALILFSLHSLLYLVVYKALPFRNLAFRKIALQEPCPSLKLRRSNIALRIVEWPFSIKFVWLVLKLHSTYNTFSIKHCYCNLKHRTLVCNTIFNIITLSTISIDTVIVNTVTTRQWI